MIYSLLVSQSLVSCSFGVGMCGSCVKPQRISEFTSRVAWQLSVSQGLGSMESVRNFARRTIILTSLGLLFCIVFKLSYAMTQYINLFF
jgi:hypothetical protein